MKEVLKIENGKIIGHSIINREPRENEVEVNNWNGTVGEPLTFYNNDYSRKGDVELMEEGLIDIPRGHKIENGELVEKGEGERQLTEEEILQRQISELKGYLYSTDWVVIKTLELQMKGEKVTHDYSDILAEREKARAKINELEAITVVDGAK